MSQIAIFRMSCCNREIAFGRTQGDPMYPPTKKQCPFGCPVKKGIGKRVQRVALIFDRFEFDDTISPELLRTWKHGHSTGDLWPKYEAKRNTKIRDVQR